MNKKIRALVLLSGGLDSMLAVKVLQEQGIEVVGLSFKSCFFDTLKARESIGQLGIELKEVDFSIDHLKMTKNPPNGYGKNMNPCIDCHGMMLQYAKRIMEDEGFDFVATGEVLGQRPMSQNRTALQRVAKISDLGDRLLRPLSAKLLNETELERIGKIDRGKLQNVEGRGRDKQFELAKKYNITEYPFPGGGCLLTDVSFGQRLKTLFTNWPTCDINDAAILKTGRIYWFNVQSDRILALVGRDMQDNENMLKLIKEDDVLVELVDEIGPTTLIRGLKNLNKEEQILSIDVPNALNFAKEDFLETKTEADILQIVATLTAYYATRLRGKTVKVRIK
ncbi:tRNA 4-thiouridine(8) synthase ThiI [Candidatus Parcubacteria bacterium]|nr:tRNA 4-thiouridine(8) synthase ThiI [Patescibacteria group bacterium]MBU4309462.1 tRNA 4-thiouridine(8) synthase ThiI [Patescibacteria group bacterium]MBU4432424.1 tRNA 4-thiouridine(8) synthase ThiI [Patescibacteria group bacterium]MBU4577823.1 tRNA 4-thiouridine(8) synthase ThiI [Patescibacteria group bacterium]MCG2696816.1 tRNA 4-thiouridine(8) synthase ThiI [Candidatus Parcubacteria bacterium]